MKAVALYYLGLLDDIRAAARGMGYAVGLHGSMQRDFDLIACPWRDDAKPAEELVQAVAYVVGGAVHMQGATAKPHGRRAWTIHIGWHDELRTTTVIDLSVMPLASEHPEVQRLKRGDFTTEEFQNLCHNRHEKPGCTREEFEAGCAEFQRKMFGAPEGD